MKPKKGKLITMNMSKNGNFFTELLLRLQCIWIFFPPSTVKPIFNNRYLMLLCLKIESVIRTASILLLLPQLESRGQNFCNMKRQYKIVG